MATLEEKLKKIEETLPNEIKDDDAQEKYLAAIAQLTRYIKKYPESAQVFTLRGKLYYKLKRYPDAEIDLKKALTLSKSADPEVLFQYGHLQNLCKHYKEAIPFFKQCLRLSNDKHAKAHNHLCVCYVSTKNYDKALEHINFAIEQDKNNALFYSNRARVRDHLLRPDTSLKEKIAAYQRIIKDLDTAIALDPSNEKNIENRRAFAKKLEAAENELKEKINAPLDLHLSSSLDPTPQPDSASPASESLPLPTPAQHSQTKRKAGTATFFTQTQNSEATSFKASKRSKFIQKASENDANPPIPPSAPIAGTAKSRNPSPHPWQSLPLTPTPPDDDASPPIPPSAPIVSDTKSRNHSPHPWQSLPPTPTPPDLEVPPSITPSPH